MIENGADRVRPAVDQGARIRAVVLGACLRVRAVLMGGTLMRDGAARADGIAGGAVRTRATVRPVEIDALRARMAGLILALVDVQTVLGTGDEAVAASTKDTV